MSDISQEDDDIVDNLSSDLDELSVPDRQDCIRHVIEARSRPVETSDTVSLLECNNGTKVYLVGTAHFSEQSIGEVNEIIQRTQPDFILVELCKSRVSILSLDEERIKREAKNIQFTTFIRQRGFVRGLTEYLIQRVNIHLIEQIGMAPGGEFRAALRSSLLLKHSHFVLGDRPINATLSRVVNSLGPWTRLMFFMSLLQDIGPITKEDVEELKKADIIDQLLKLLGESHPELLSVIVDERDQYLTRSIWELTGMDIASAESGNNSVGLRCCDDWPSLDELPRVIVAVVGLGHKAGIERYWPNAHRIDKQALVEIIPPPMSWRLFKWSLLGLFTSLFALVGYGLTRSTLRALAYFKR